MDADSLATEKSEWDTRRLDIFLLIVVVVVVLQYGNLECREPRWFTGRDSPRPLSFLVNDPGENVQNAAQVLDQISPSTFLFIVS